MLTTHISHHKICLCQLLLGHHSPRDRHGHASTIPITVPCHLQYWRHHKHLCQVLALVPSRANPFH